ncbi:MAG: methyltransferase [Sphaerochaetaceae bacterium]|nr:methyltransferase [Sphaerochaetaceae bacterium]
MSHYYTKNNDKLSSQEKDIFFKIKDEKFHFITDNGVFSKSGLDFGSRLLLEVIVNINKDSMLDLGCGYGPIGIVYKYFNPKSEVTMTDINVRATSLAEKNAKNNNLKINVLNGDGFESIKSTFDIIITNPPIRTGKENIYNFFEQSIDFLNDFGELYYVMHKKHGVSSAIKKCKEIFSNVEVVCKKSGYHIVKCRK